MGSPARTLGYTIGSSISSAGTETGQVPVWGSRPSAQGQADATFGVRKELYTLVRLAQTGEGGLISSVASPWDPLSVC